MVNMVLKVRVSKFRRAVVFLFIKIAPIAVYYGVSPDRVCRGADWMASYLVRSIKLKVAS